VPIALLSLSYSGHLRADNCPTWEIKRVNLGEHVGHTVRVTGVVSHAKCMG